MTTIEKHLKSLNIELTYKQMDETSTKFMLLALMDPNFLEQLLESDDYNKEFGFLMMTKRIDHYKLTGKVLPETLAMYLSFSLDTPGKIMIYLIRLLEFYEVNQTPATLNDLTTNIFPFGFYDDDTCLSIIDNCFKTEKTYHSDLY